ncbi:RHS repeat domain-containing protein [Flavobacterium sp. GCM10023249]|uniref:RHS repeat domain-containing protein n=1 Tax=unclassified Flavobacterium TaxID=196869 RepID=UPI003612EA24
MNTSHKFRRAIATFFLLIFLPTLVPANLYASNNGPKSPEAGSFEPVDATDMVNLITGQYSYVLPLLNVPSPEGGYPIAMGYHAGIAMDQESSWAGLGWNINPGAIDRGINGYPDDYNASELNEYFWDKTHTDTRYTASVGYSSGFASVGVGFSWGNNQSLSGQVSIGAGLGIAGVGILGVNATASSDMTASIGIGLTTVSGLTVGLNANSNGEVGVKAGFSNNGEGFSVSYSSNGTFSMGLDLNTGNSSSVNLDYSISSRGSSIGIDVNNKTKYGNSGSGMSLAFGNTVSMGDYSTSSSGWTIPIVVPTQYGVFSASFGKQEFKYWMGKNKYDVVLGALNFDKSIEDVLIWGYMPPYYAFHTVNALCGYNANNTGYCQYNDIQYGPHGYQKWHYGSFPCNGSAYDLATYNGPHNAAGYSYVKDTKNAFMDIVETSFEGNDFAKGTDVKGDNMTFPAYDNFSLSAQGISGSMSAVHYKNGALFGLNDKENKEGYSLKYTVRNTAASNNNITKFNSMPQFEFDNEITSYLGVNAATFNNNASITNVLSQYSSGVDVNDKPRRTTSHYIEYYTNDQILNNYSGLKDKGFLLPEGTGFDRSKMPKNGVGAFKVTTIDGKTYHYSLPVYNHEVITRTFGVLNKSPEEKDSYFEKRQLEPFATHWLLTAVTGPDYVDNGDGVAGEGDLGYWTAFEYGKWTDAFIWKNPYKKDYIIDEKDPKIKTWIRGRKQLYYLDKIKTRTHTALFIKNEREDAMSSTWSYDSAVHKDDLENNSIVYGRFVVPSQKQLRLEKIVLLKNDDAKNVNKDFGPDDNKTVLIKYNQSGTKENEPAKYQCFDNVLDLNDNWEAMVPKSSKVIDLTYDYSLVPGDNRLTLKEIDFKGKGGKKVLPAYKFEYLNDTQNFNPDNKDGWGYNFENPSFFSLKKIITPQGGEISMEYERNKFKTLVPYVLDFTRDNPAYKIYGYSAHIDGRADSFFIKLVDGNRFPNLLNRDVSIDYDAYGKDFSNNEMIQYKYKGPGRIIRKVDANNYEVAITGQYTVIRTGRILGSDDLDLWRDSAIISCSIKLGGDDVFSESSPRVSKVKVSDGVNTYVMDYKYGKDEDGIGYVSYIPFAQNVAKEVPYSSELPSPRIMFDYITVSSHKEGLVSQGKMRYRFNIMKEKDPAKIKFGDFYEIEKTSNYSFVNTGVNKNVSVNSYVVKENFAALGQLLEVVSLNDKGHILNKVYSNYYDINSIPSNIGVTQESYQSYKEVDYKDNTNIKDKWVINSSTRVKYPSIIKSSTEERGGYKYTTEFKDWDLISGISKEQIYSSSDGKIFKTKVVPAYIKYGAMGSKVVDVNNRNMLSQTAVEYSYIYDPTDAVKPWKETGVGITTWSNEWIYQDIQGNLTAASTDNEKIWRKHKNYVWNGMKDNEGIFQNYNSATDDGFDWTVGVGSQPVKWKQISEVTKYDHYSIILEVKDVNNNHVATKMGDKETKITAVGNAKYNELYYSGLENIDGVWLEPGMSLNGATRDNTKSHSGKYSLAVNSPGKLNIDLKDNQHKAGRYKLNVWVHKDNAGYARLLINGATVSFNGPSKQAGDWILKTHYFDMTTAATTVSLIAKTGATVYYDDIMLRPIASSVTGYVYNEWDELSHIVGNNGLATRFEYDAAGRLVKTYVEVFDDQPNGLTGGFKISSENKMHYKNL